MKIFTYTLLLWTLILCAKTFQLQGTETQSSQNLKVNENFKAEQTKIFIYYLGLPFFSKIPHYNKTLETFNNSNFTYTQETIVGNRKYSIVDARPTYIYEGRNQSATISPSSYFYVEVSEGTVRLNFNWTIKDGDSVVNKGTGVAEASLKPVSYQAGLEQSGTGFYNTQLVNWIDPKVQTFNIVSTSPKLIFADQAYFNAIINT